MVPKRRGGGGGGGRGWEFKNYRPISLVGSLYKLIAMKHEHAYMVKFLCVGHSRVRCMSDMPRGMLLTR